MTDLWKQDQKQPEWVQSVQNLDSTFASTTQDSSSWILLQKNDQSPCGCQAGESENEAFCKVRDCGVLFISLLCVPVSRDTNTKNGRMNLGHTILDISPLRIHKVIL